MRMHEVGIIERMRKRWWHRSGTCEGNKISSSAHALAIEHIAGAMIVYLIVTAMSIICFMVEILLCCRQKSRSFEIKTQSNMS